MEEGGYKGSSSKGRPIGFGCATAFVLVAGFFWFASADFFGLPSYWYIARTLILVGLLAGLIFSAVRAVVNRIF